MPSVPPRDIVVIAASVGGVEALCQIVRRLPADLPAALLFVLHTGAHQSRLPEILAKSGALPAHHARHYDPVQNGRIYVAPPDHHMRIGAHGIELDRGPKEHYARPAADPLFRSAANCYHERVLGIVMTGGDTDGAQGLIDIKAAGGITVVQDPRQAKSPEMPISALLKDSPDFCLPINEIAALIERLSKGGCLPGAKRNSHLASSAE
jgi:two-component system chemotaxis response regulator CheB